MDHNVPRAITNGLKLKGIDLITAYEDGSSQLDDSELLDRASELERVLFTRDYNLLQEATKRQRAGVPFYGIIYAHQLKISIGDCIRDLEIIAEAGDPEDLINQVQFLPL
jgi:uncharacterized protein with PIN domain